MVKSGEVYMLLNSPFFKERYAVSLNFYVGCRIACEFCYYRMAEVTEPYFRPNSKLKKVGDYKKVIRLLNEADLIPPEAPVIVCASSDCGMPENQRELKALFENIDRVKGEYKFFLLHRLPWTKREVELFKDHPEAVFGTTITPLASEKGYNKIKDNQQIKGLFRIREAGVSKGRISIELGWINPENFEASVEIANFLKEQDIVDFITIRGVSLGKYDGQGEKVVKELIEKGFISKEEYERLKEGYRYFDGKREKVHEFYLVKNYLSEKLYKEFLNRVNPDLRVHRNTATLYREEYGFPIALNRNNKPRKELVERYGIEIPAERELKRVADLIERLTGQTPDLEVKEGVLSVKGVRATEDIAHRVGRELQIPVIFNNFDNQPTLEDVKTLPAYRQILGL